MMTKFVLPGAANEKEMVQHQSVSDAKKVRSAVMIRPENVTLAPNFQAMFHHEAQPPWIACSLLPL
jgi:hypothetical protein